MKEMVRMLWSKKQKLKVQLLWRGPSPKPPMAMFLQWQRPNRRLKEQMLWRRPWEQSCRSRVQKHPSTQLVQML